MERIYYRDQVLETIARKVLCAYDAILFYGDPQPIPVEEIMMVCAAIWMPGIT